MVFASVSNWSYVWNQKKIIWYLLHGLWQLFRKSAISETYGEGASDNRKFRVKSNPLIVYTEPLVKRSLQMLRRFAFTDPSLHKRCCCRQTNEKHYSLCKTGIVKRVYKIRDRLPSLWLNIDRLSDHQAG